MADLDDKEGREQVGIPDDMRVKRRYAMSEEALEQRRDAAKQPKPGMLGKRNNWKHGLYSQSFLTRIKPCKRSCPDFPCRLVEENTTEPGGDCLDAAELLEVIHAVSDAIKDPKNADRFNEIAAVNIANSIKILEMLQEDVFRDGSVVKSEKYNKEGMLSQVEYKAHPALLAIPKMISDLGLHPENFMITPKVQAKHANEEEGLKTISDMIKGVGDILKPKADQD